MAVTTEQMTLALNIPPSAPPHVYAAAAEQCLQWGRPDGALKVSQLGLDRHPSYTGLRVFRAEALLQSNRVDEAEKDLRAVLGAEPQHPKAVKLLATLLVTERRWKEALPVLDRAEFILSDDAEIAAWLKQAEEFAASGAPDSEGPQNFVFSEETANRVSGLTTLKGVRAVSVSDDRNARRFGEEGQALSRLLDGLEPLEGRIGQILERLGFGSLKEISIQCDDTRLVSHHNGAILRVATDSTVREGLVNWHCAKILGENPE